MIPYLSYIQPLVLTNSCYNFCNHCNHSTQIHILQTLGKSPLDNSLWIHGDDDVDDDCDDDGCDSGDHNEDDYSH